MVLVERVLKWLVLVGVLAALIAAFTLPIGCGYCLRAVLFEKPVGRVGEIQVFAGEGASPARARTVLRHLPEAVRRVEALIGPKGLRADVVVAPRPAFGEQADYAGAMYSSLLGSPVIVLPIDSVSVDTTAHELVHAVLNNRLSHWRAETAMPHWFNEGMATQVDMSNGFGVDALCALVGDYGWPNASALEYSVAFYNTGGRRELVRNYAWSKGMVWHMRAHGDFDALLTRFLDGQSWQATLAPLSRSAEPAIRRNLCI